MKMTISEQLKQIISDYDAVIKVIEKDAQESEDRACGGFVRMAKGRLQEHISENIARIAWQSIGGNPDNLEINPKKVSIPMKPSYLNRIKDDEVVTHIKKNIVNYVYKLSVDEHIYVNKKFVIGIECKAFAENAMIKRILIDFDLLLTQYPHLSCYLFQLESQLGGDYSELTKPIYGSYSTRTLQSYFSCELNIITLLQGERNINRPIHKNFKSLRLEQLSDAMEILAEDMKRFH